MVRGVVGFGRLAGVLACVFATGCALSAPAADVTLAGEREATGEPSAVELDALAAGALAAARRASDDPSAQIAAAEWLFRAADHRMQAATVAWLDAHPEAGLDAVLDAGERCDDEVRRAVVSLCNDGLAAAETALRLAPAAAGVDLQVALHTSLLAWANGPARSLLAGYGPRLVRAVEAAVAADPRFDGAGPLRLLGRFRAEAPWPYGDRAAARVALERAVELAPVAINHLFLGDLLADVGEQAAAREAWQAALDAPPDASMRWTEDLLRHQARRRLAAVR